MSQMSKTSVNSDKIIVLTQFLMTRYPICYLCRTEKYLCEFSLDFVSNVIKIVERATAQDIDDTTQ